MSSGIDMSFVIGRAKPAGAASQTQQPGSLFRVLVLGDFSGRTSRRSEQDAAPTFKPIGVDLDTFDSVFQRMSPSLRMQLPQAPDAPVRLGLRSLEDFEPDALFGRLPLFAQLRDLRARLANPSTFEQAAAELRANDRAAQASGPAAAAPAAAEDDASTLQRLLGSTPSATPAVSATTRSANSVEGAVDRLIRNMVAPHVVPATSHLQQPMIDSLDRAIGDTMRAVLRDPHWRALEGAWRSVDQFVRSVEMDGQVLLELVDASAADVLDSLVAAEGDAARMPLSRSLEARRVHEGQEEGYALVVALYEFGSSAPELALLAGLGAIAAREGAVFVGSAAATLALVEAPEAWGDAMPQPADAAAQGRWKAMRASWMAPHIALVWPQVLARLPYGAKTQPVSAFAFEELVGEHVHGHLPWRLAALDVASLLAKAYTEAGWDLQPESSLELEDLPSFTDRSGDTPRMQATAELFMSERQAQALLMNGLMPLISHRTLPHARLGGWRSISAQSPVLKGRWQA